MAAIGEHAIPTARLYDKSVILCQKRAWKGLYHWIKRRDFLKKEMGTFREKYFQENLWEDSVGIMEKFRKEEMVII